MSLCRPIKSGISTQCVLHQLCPSHNASVALCITSNATVHQHQASQDRIIGPAQLLEQHTDKNSYCPTSQDFLHFSSQKNGEIVAESLEALGWGHVNRKYPSVCLGQPNMVMLPCQCGSLGKAHPAVCPAGTSSEHNSSFFFAFLYKRALPICAQ